MFLDLVNNTPPVYTEESRDFQLFLRLYNAEINSVINDIDLMQYLTDSKRCKTELLPLVKSRLGFDTNYQISSDVLRGILVGFPELLRNKGSLNGVVVATNLFLKALNIKADIIIYYTASGEVAMEREVNDHTVVIGINEAIDNYYVLEELMKYILPAGFGFSFFFYKDYNKYDWIRDLNSAELLFVGDDYADAVRYNFYDNSKSYVVNDIVMYDGLAYRCIDASTGNVPSISPLYWTIDEAVTRIVSSVSTLGIYSGDISAANKYIEQIYIEDGGNDIDVNTKFRYNYAYIVSSNSIRVTVNFAQNIIEEASTIQIIAYNGSSQMETTYINASDYTSDNVVTFLSNITSATKLNLTVLDSNNSPLTDTVTIEVVK